MANNLKTASKKGFSLLATALAFIVFIGLVSWGPAPKTYSNRFISFSYPNKFKITDEEDGGDEYDLNCEYKGKYLAIINFSITTVSDAKGLDQESIDDILKNSIKTIRETLESNENYTDIECSSIKKATKGDNTGYEFIFSAKFMEFPIYGKSFITYSDGTLVVAVAQAENTDLMDQLNDIISSMKIK